MKEAVRLISSLDKDLLEILFLSMKVNLLALTIACLISLPFGAALGILRFPFRGTIIVIINSLMSLPPVVVGLIVYIYLSRTGPLGWLGLLYTPTAMIIAQVILIAPIITSLSCQIIEDLHNEYRDLFSSLVVPKSKAILAYLVDSRHSLMTVILAGLGRGLSEVGAVVIVGGNIDHLTRVMTSAISLETSKGNLPLALALGFILLVIALSINFLGSFIKNYARDKAYV